MFNIAILEDDNVYREYLRDLINQVITEENLPGKVWLDTDRPREIIKVLEGNNPLNVFFLDISIHGEPEGFELAKYINQYVENDHIIFISEKVDFVFNSFRVKAFDFITKPANKKSIQRVFSELVMSFKKKSFSGNSAQSPDKWSSHENDPNESKIAIKFGASIQYIQPDKLLYIEQQRNKAIYHVDNQCVMTYDTLDAIYKSLGKYRLFIRTHRSFVVNTSRIEKINFAQKEIEMDNGEICLIGNRYKEGLKNLEGI